MKVRHINPHTMNSSELLKEIVTFNHGEMIEGVAKVITLEGSRRVIVCWITAAKMVDVFLYPRDTTKNMMMVEPHIRRLLDAKNGWGAGFTMGIDGMPSVRCQISD